MKENETKYMTLSLPLIKIGSGDLYSLNNYKEDGMFFVQTQDNIVRVVDVCKSQQSVGVFDLPIGVIASLVAGHSVSNATTLISDKLQRLEDVIQNMTIELVGHLNHNTQSVIEKIKVVSEVLDEKSESLQDISQSVMKLLNEQQSSTKGMGYVSQETLVEILHTIKQLS